MIIYIFEGVIFSVTKSRQLQVQFSDLVGVLGSYSTSYIIQTSKIIETP